MQNAPVITEAEKKAIEAELNRLNNLHELDLVKVLDALDIDPMPDHLKKMFVTKINNILNERIGVEPNRGR